MRVIVWHGLKSVQGKKLLVRSNLGRSYRETGMGGSKDPSPGGELFVFIQISPPAYLTLEKGMVANPSKKTPHRRFFVRLCQRILWGVFFYSVNRINLAKRKFDFSDLLVNEMYCHDLKPPNKTGLTDENIRMATTHLLRVLPFPSIS